jgi:hypothetical protein
VEDGGDVLGVVEAAVIEVTGFREVSELREVTGLWDDAEIGEVTGPG